VYYLLGIDDTDSSANNDTSVNTTHLALALGQKLESLNLAKLLNISCHQLFLHPSVPHTSNNTTCCLLLDCYPQMVREIDMITRLTLRGESAASANPGYALAAWHQFDPEVVAWGKMAKNLTLMRMDALVLARRSGILIAGINGSGAGVIGALAAVGLRYDGNDGYIQWMPGLDRLTGIFNQLEMNQFIRFESIESEHHHHPALDDRILFSREVKPVIVNSRIVLMVSPAKRGEEFQWIS
jgi:hypothetical protein